MLWSARSAVDLPQTLQQIPVQRKKKVPWTSTTMQEALKSPQEEHTTSTGLPSLAVPVGRIKKPHLEDLKGVDERDELAQQAVKLLRGQLVQNALHLAQRLQQQQHQHGAAWAAAPDAVGVQRVQHALQQHLLLLLLVRRWRPSTAQQARLHAGA